MKSLFSLLLATLSFSVYAATIESSVLKTPRGESVPVDLHLPAEDKAPALIMAPGGNYHKENAIFTLAAERAVKAGIAVLRMDWAYCKRDPNTNRCTGKYSEDLVPETEDLETVVDFVKTHPRLDPKSIILSGKSLGTLVGYKVFQKRPEDFHSLALLTPLCSEAGDVVRSICETSYPKFESIKKPVLFLIGSLDHGATHLPHLWEFLAKKDQGHVSVSVVGGDHGLLIDTSVAASQEPNARNLNLAIDNLIAWIHRNL